MNDAFWRSSQGIAFLKAQAAHEAGQRYPAPPEDWLKAQAIVFNSSAPVSPPTPAPVPPRPKPTPKPVRKPTQDELIDKALRDLEPK